MTAPESEDSQDGIGGPFSDASEINGSVSEQRSVVRSFKASRDPLNMLTVDSGLHIGTVTNFEFAVPPRDSQPANVDTYTDPLASADATWNVDSPLSGKADLRLDFTFRDEPGRYDEWLGVDIQSRVTDVSQ